jgi:hypothetical protein
MEENRYATMSTQEVLIDRLETRCTESQLRTMYAKRLYNQNRHFDIKLVPRHYVLIAFREMNSTEWREMMQELTTDWYKFWVRK